MTLWRWANKFCDIPTEYHITAGEGETPLVRSRQIGPSSGLDQLYFKLESANPTGSYKDRYAASAISHMLRGGKSRSIGTSSGNTGAAIAAYCARANLACEIAIVEKAPMGKLKQMLAYGAHIYKVKGMGIDPAVSEFVIAQLQAKAEMPGAQLQISAFHYSPDGMAGVKTISYELAEQAAASGIALEHVFVPAGGGGLNLAVVRGFLDLVNQGTLPASPAVHCVQPEGNNTIAGPLREGAQQAQAVTVTSQISGLQVGNVIDGHETVNACRSVGGTGYLLSDEAIWHAQKRLAREEGLFCEPAGAVALAGALDARQRGEIGCDSPVVCLVTGIGFKDPPSVDRMAEAEDCPVIAPEEIMAQ